MAKAKKVEKWSDIDPQVFVDFEAAVDKLHEEMIPRDSDGSSPVQYLIVNRMLYESINYFPVPRHQIYSYIQHGYLEMHPDKEREMQDETERMLSANVHAAAEALDSYMRTKYHKGFRDRENKRPIADLIKEKCDLCRTGMGFDRKNKKDFYETIRSKYPDYPARFHKDGNECKAFELHRIVFNTNHPEYAGKPESKKWCMNPDCRCLLPGYSKSKKGAWVCINDRCRLDNSKFYGQLEEE